MAASSAQRILESDLSQADFLMGVADRRWALERPVTEAAWPFVFTRINAAARPNSPDSFLVRWDLAGYNGQSPTGAFWDTSSGAYLAAPQWPKGRPGSVVATVFKTDGWAKPGQGFYHPYDRQALVGHADWPAANPRCVWSPDKTLIDFLTLVHRWLHCEDYLGC